MKVSSYTFNINMHQSVLSLLKLIFYYSDVDIEAQFSLNQSRAEEITMREEYGSISLVNHDDGFGDMGFDTDAPDLMRHASGLEPSMEHVYFSILCHIIICILKMVLFCFL